MADMVFSGFGGQGVLTAGLILAKTAMDFGDNVTWIPSYGSEMRGGTANCNIKVSPDKIASPFVKDVDICVAMNIPSVAKFMPQLRSGATLVVNSSMVPADYEYRGDINVITVPATQIANDCGYHRGGNIVMLGALASAGVIYDKSVYEKGIEDFFALKGKSNPKNLECFEAGYEQSVRLAGRV